MGPKISSKPSGFAGFVSSANQKSTDESYPYYYNSEGFEQYRGRIINNALSKMDSITVKDMKALQNNNFSLIAQELLPLLLKNTDTTALSAPEKAILPRSFLFLQFQMKM